MPVPPFTDPSLARPESDLPTQPDASEAPQLKPASEATDWLKAVSIAWALAPACSFQELRLAEMKHAASADEEVDVVALTEWALEERLRLGLKSYEEQADERSVKESG